MTAERGKLEQRLKELMAAKKSAKGVDDAAFVRKSAEIVEVLESIARLPEDYKLTDFQIGTYCWSLYAVASKSIDQSRRRDFAVRLVKAYHRAVDCPQFWGHPRADEFGRTLFNSMVVALYKEIKDSNVETGETALRSAARPFVEILDKRANDFLDEAGFHKEPVTDEQKAAMERNNGGKPIRMKTWPSIAEKAFGLVNRCLKADRTLQLPPQLVDFLYLNTKKGEWLGFYCANAMLRAGRFEEARGLLLDVVRKKPEEGWSWIHLAETYTDSPQNAVACLCRSLTCRIHNQEMSTESKTHRLLARILAALGDSATAARESEYASGKVVSAEDITRYGLESRKANLLVFGDKVVPTKKRISKGQTATSDVRFRGRLIKPKGKSFGFVECREVGTVFIPPRFASKKYQGDEIVGWAAMREDKKKKRMALCMISDL